MSNVLIYTSNRKNKVGEGVAGYLYEEYNDDKKFCTISFQLYWI